MRPLRKIITLSLLACCLINMTGCALFSPRYRVVDGKEMVQVDKKTLSDLYRDNEALLEALKQCK